MEIGSIADFVGVAVTFGAGVAAFLAYRAQEKQIRQSRRAVINSNLTTIASLLDSQYSLKAPGLDFLVPIVWLADGIYQEDRQADKRVKLFKSACLYILKHPAVYNSPSSLLVDFCEVHHTDPNLCPKSVLRYLATYVLEKPKVSEERRLKFEVLMESYKNSDPI